MMEQSEWLVESTLQIPIPGAPTVDIFCTGKISGGQDCLFLF
jgi:hypothetical protein